jgi:hypothetical protein
MGGKRGEPVVETGEDLEGPENRMIDAVTMAEQEALETLDDVGAATADSVAKAQVEIVTFIARRVQEDLDTQRALLDCRSLDEVRRVQTRFIERAVSQYAEETSRMMRLGGEAVTRAFGSHIR